MLVITQLKKVGHVTLFKCINDIRVDCPKKVVNVEIISSFNKILNCPFRHEAELELDKLIKTCPTFQPNLTFYQEEEMAELCYAITDKELLTNRKQFRFNICIDWEASFKNFAN